MIIEEIHVIVTWGDTKFTTQIIFAFLWFSLLGLRFWYCFSPRSQSQTMVFLPNPPLSASSSESSTRTTTGRCSWKKSIRSSSQSGRGLREKEPRKETLCIGSLPLIVMRDPMQRSLTASRRETRMGSSLSSPRPAWCLQKSSRLLENMTFLQWVSNPGASSCHQPDSLSVSRNSFFFKKRMVVFYCFSLLVCLPFFFFYQFLC